MTASNLRELYELLIQLDEYFLDRADIIGDSEHLQSNTEMKFLCSVREQQEIVEKELAK
jgi:hypothetical protein